MISLVVKLIEFIASSAVSGVVKLNCCACQMDIAWLEGYVSIGGKLLYDSWCKQRHNRDERNLKR